MLVFKGVCLREVYFLWGRVEDGDIGIIFFFFFREFEAVRWDRGV